jgi:8-oxo-dGTP pyrophosphatase MutT (NUDIX family)
MGPARSPALLLAGDARLEPLIERGPARRRVRATLAAYSPPDALQAELRARMLAFLAEHEDALERSCAPGHFTASALVVDAARERALLTLHTKLGRWLQLGGHCDGDGNLGASALREAREESGIEDLALAPAPIDLDIHAIPARAGEPEHLHLDVRFLVVAPPGAVARASSESIELRWLAAAELASITTDDSVRRLYRIAFGAPQASTARRSS